jgi:hypothetical protein
VKPPKEQGLFIFEEKQKAQTTIVCSAMPHTLKTYFFPPNLNLKPWSYWFVIPWKGVEKISYPAIFKVRTNLKPRLVLTSFLIRTQHWFFYVGYKPWALYCCFPDRVVRCEQWVCGTCGSLPFLWAGLKIVVENQESLTQEGSTQFDTFFLVLFCFEVLSTSYFHEVHKSLHVRESSTWVHIH